MNEGRHVPFDNVIADVSGGNLKTPQSEFLPSGQYAIVDQGKELVAGYTNDEARLCTAQLPVIVFGDHTRCFKYVDFPFCMGADGVKVLRPKVEADVKYLYHYLRQLRLPDGGYDRHFKYLKRSSIVLPPLSEQRGIVEILDKADALRAKRGAALVQLDTLTQSIFLEMFGDPAKNPKGWPVAALAELCTVSGEYGAGVASKSYDPTLPRYVRITDITENGKLTNDAVSPGGSPVDWESYSLKPGDILFARSGATVGKTYLHRESNGRCVFAGYLIRFRTRRERLLPEFLFEFTRTAAYRSWVEVRQRVVAQPNINARQYGYELFVPCPPIGLQERLTERVRSIGRIEVKQDAAIAEGDALFASLRHRAFRGEV